MPEATRFDPRTIAAIGKLPLIARTVVEGFLTGRHSSPYHGFSVEFAEHRKYAPGDSLRDLDWTAYARTGRYYIKRYREETNLRCRIILDASGSMGFGSDGVTKIDYGCCLAAALAYLAIRQRDAVGLTLCAGDSASDLPPSARHAHLQELFQRLESARAGGRPPIWQSMEQTARLLRRRGLVVAISDLLDEETELVKALKHLRHRRHEVILFHLLDAAEEELPYRHIGEFVDLETGAKLMVDPQAVRDVYIEEIRAFRQRFKRIAGDCGIDYVAVNTAEPFERLLHRYLLRRGRS